MQRITNISKYLILALLSSTFLMTWNGSFSITGENWNGLNTGTISNTGEITKSPTPVVAKAPVVTNPKKAKAFYTQQQSNSIWHKMSNNFSINHKTQTKRVKKEIRLLLSNRKHFNHILQSSAPYIYFIYQQTKAYGLPAEIALIPFIESEFSPNDHSNKGALGLWQLMPATARGLGVKRIGSSYDGRRNVIASTTAALKYFRYLGKTFHRNWYLAIAAYNAGDGAVRSAKRRAGSSNFFNLHLPRETRIYVPKLLAVAEIIAHPKRYGITLPKISDRPYFTKVKVNKPVTLAHVAKYSGINLKTLRKLNPDVKPGRVTPVKHGVRSLLVPVGKAASVKV